MLNITNIENALYYWVSTVSGLATIIAHPNAPRPTTAYVTIHIPQSTPIGVAESNSVVLPDNSIDVDYSNLEELFVSINVYKGSAQTVATTLKDSLARVTVTDQLFSEGLGYLRSSSVREIPDVVNKKYENRSQFDCFFSIRSLDSENIETIQKVEITNNINDDGEAVVIEKA